MQNYINPLKFHTLMINKKSFERMQKQLEDKDKEREELIGISREIGKFSKQAIYSLHRKEIKEAEALLEQARKKMKNCKQYVGAYDNSLEEYAEAAAYLGFIKGKIPDEKDLGIDTETYLGGLCDLTGELARLAVFSVVEENYKQVKKIKDVVSDIYDEFLKFDFRNGELRKKSDSIKWNLKKIEEILYDLKIRDKL